MGGFDASGNFTLRVYESVSIPERVWGVLMQKVMKWAQTNKPVSIPERVWGVLMRAIA